MSKEQWVTVIRIPQEGNRISGIFLADDDVFSGSMHERELKWMAWLNELFRNSYGYEDPVFTARQGWPDTGSICSYTVRDSEPTDIARYDVCLFTAFPTHAEDYRFKEWMLEDEQ